MSKKCFLRRTEIKLADDVKYVFRALPLTEKTIELVKTFSQDEDGMAKMDAFRKAIAYSLSYDQSEEVVNELFESGLIPLEANDAELYGEILGALMAQGEKK